MDILDKLAERHIQAAMERGEFDNLPGAGCPLDLDDDSMVPPELRAGYRLLRNSGYLPPELQLRGEIRSVEDLMRAARTEPERNAARRRLLALRTRLAHARGGEALLAVDDYAALLERRFGGGESD